MSTSDKNLKSPGTEGAEATFTVTAEEYQELLENRAQRYIDEQLNSDPHVNPDLLSIEFLLSDPEIKSMLEEWVNADVELIKRDREKQAKQKQLREAAEKQKQLIAVRQNMRQYQGKPTPQGAIVLKMPEFLKDVSPAQREQLPKRFVEEWNRREHILYWMALRGNLISYMTWLKGKFSELDDTMQEALRPRFEQWKTKREPIISMVSEILEDIFGVKDFKDSRYHADPVTWRTVKVEINKSGEMAWFGSVTVDGMIEVHEKKQEAQRDHQEHLENAAKTGAARQKFKEEIAAKLRTVDVDADSATRMARNLVKKNRGQDNTVTEILRRAAVGKQLAHVKKGYDGTEKLALTYAQASGWAETNLLEEINMILLEEEEARKAQEDPNYGTIKIEGRRPDGKEAKAKFDRGEKPDGGKKKKK